MTSKQRKTKQTRAEKKQTEMFRLRGIASAKVQRTSLQWSENNKPPAYEKFTKELNECIANPELLNGDNKFVMRSLVKLYKFRLILEGRLISAKKRDGLVIQDQAAKVLYQLDELIQGVKTTRKKSAAKGISKRKTNFDGYIKPITKRVDERAQKVKIDFEKIRKRTPNRSVAQIKEELASKYNCSSGTIGNDLAR